MPTLAWLVGDSDRDPEGIATAALVRVFSRLHLPPSHDGSPVATAALGTGDFSDGHTSTVGVGPVTSQPPDMT